MKPYYTSKHTTLYHGDCLEIMPELADNSIDLIATDPPYFGVKDDDWDNQWKNTATFLDWMGELCQQWKRVLKPNGSLYVFASPQMSARVECKIGEYFNVLNNIRWLKEAGWHNKAEKESLRGFLEPWESVVFAEQFGSDEGAQDEAGYISACIRTKRGIFGDYLNSEFERAQVTRKEIAALFPSITGNLTGCVSNWVLGLNCPTSDQYEKLRAFLNSRGGEFLRREYEDLRREYEDLRREYEDLRREYEDLRRPFNVSPQVPFTDVWDFKTVKPYAGKHVCEKPLAMMEHIINSSSRAGGVVLDCFVGSGTTLEAAQRLGRNSIGVEMDAHWCGQIERRLAQRDLFSVAIERDEIDAAQNLFLEPEPIASEKQMEMVL